MDVDGRLLQDLIDHGRYAQVHALVSTEQIAQAWLAYHREPRHSDAGDNPLWWPIDLCQSDPTLDLMSLIEVLVDHAANEDELCIIGSTVMDSCLNYQTQMPETVLAWVEHQAASSSKFQTALGHVFANNALGPTVMDRLETAANRTLQHWNL